MSVWDEVEREAYERSLHTGQHIRITGLEVVANRLSAGEAEARGWRWAADSDVLLPNAHCLRRLHVEAARRQHG